MPALPDCVIVAADGYAEELEPGVESVPVEDGPPKRRRSRSRVMCTRTVTFGFATAADWLAFKSWFRDPAGANLGAADFDWVDPVDGVTRQAHFADGQLGQARPAAGFQLWSMTVKLRTWDA